MQFFGAEDDSSTIYCVEDGINVTHCARKLARSDGENDWAGQDQGTPGLVDSLPSSWTGEFSFSSRERGCDESTALRNRLNVVTIRCPMFSLLARIDELEACIGHKVSRILNSETFGTHTMFSLGPNEPSSHLNLDDCSRVHDAQGGGRTQ